MLAFFNSSKDRIVRFVGKKPRPFPMIADPDKHVYDLYNIKSSVAGLMAGLITRIPRLIKAMLLGFPPSMRGDMAQMPADFLIGPDLTIKGVYYGKDFADHIPISILENFADKQYKSSDPAAIPRRQARMR